MLESFHASHAGRRPLARAASTWLVSLAVCWLAMQAISQAAPPLLNDDHAARAEAIRAIPFDKLDVPTQQRLSAVINNTSVFRRMPVQVIDSDPDMYLFLIRNPEVIVNIWELMGISNVSMRRVGPYTYDAADGMGTKAKVDIVFGDKDTHVLFADGEYEGALFQRKLTGRCVAVLRTGYDRPADGRTLVASQLDVFLQVDHAGIELLAKTLHPFLGKTADTNFVESTKFVGQVSNAAERNGPGVEQLASKLTKVDPEVRDRFARLASTVYGRAMLRATQVESPAQLQPSPSPAAPLVEVRTDGVYITDMEPAVSADDEPRPAVRSGPMLRR